MDMVTLNKQLIEDCRTTRGGYITAVMVEFALILGEQLHGTDLITGWPQRLVGKQISAEKYEEIRAVRNAKMTARTRKAFRAEKLGIGPEAKQGLLFSPQNQPVAPTPAPARPIAKLTTTPTVFRTGNRFGAMRAALGYPPSE